MANKVIYLRATDTCNLDCSHCFTSGSKGKKIEFDMDQTVSWLNEWVTANPDDDKHVLIHGGEPLLVDIEKLKDLTDRYKDSGVEFGIVSNLTVKITKAHVEWFREACGGNIGTSWDYGIRFRSDKMEDYWMGNVHFLMAIGINVKVNVSVTKDLIAKGVVWLYDKLIDINPSTFSLERLTSDGNAVRNPEIFVDNEAQDRWFLDLYKEHIRRDKKVSIENFDIIEDKIFTGMPKVSTSCRDCEQHFTTLRADGGVSGCPNTADEIHADLKDGYQSYLNSPKRLDVIVKEVTPDEGCIRCNVYDLCGGDCHKLEWDSRCAGYKHLLRYLSGRGDPLDRIPLTTIE